MDVLTSLLPALFSFEPMPGTKRTKAGKLRLTREQSRARSIAGERERERFNRKTAMAFIKANPKRLAEWERRNAA